VFFRGNPRGRKALRRSNSHRHREPVINRRQSMSFKTLMPVAAIVSLGLMTAACGNNPTDRALTGGAIGAGTGAIVGSTVGAPIAGAVVGGLGGAAIGAATTPRNSY
jgi:osmotically inducible lipoprotein OsmB